MSKGLIHWLLSEDKTLKLKHHLSPGVYGSLSPLNTPINLHSCTPYRHTHSHTLTCAEHPRILRTRPEGTFQSNDWLLSEEGDWGWGVRWGPPVAELISCESYNLSTLQRVLENLWENHCFYPKGSREIAYNRKKRKWGRPIRSCTEK